MIVITAKAHPFLLTYLQKRGLKVLYEPNISYEELALLMPNVSGLVVTTRLAIDQALIAIAPLLKWIARLGSGMELIDTTFAATKNIVCISSPEGNCNAVAEHALGMLLTMQHKLVISAHLIKAGKWIREENRGNELSKKTIGIIGYGNTGVALAKLLTPFGGTLLAYDKYKKDFGGKVIREAELSQISKYADVISFHVPLSSETKYMANADFFNGLANKPFIINTARGNVVHTEALINALKENKISGAALDVLENEKLDTYTDVEKQQLDYLLNNKSVIITPHIAGYSVEAFLKMSEVVVSKLEMLQLI